MKTPPTNRMPWLRLLATTFAVPVVQMTAWAQDTQPPAQPQPSATPTAEAPPTPAPAAAAPAAATTAAKSAEMEDEIFVLSPFTVDARKDRGYFAENTLAGSRMNTKLSDLGSSISVVTKAQMQDFASHDVNDIFRYEVNTEGSSTYTPGVATFRNDGFLDVNAGGTQGSTVGSLTNAGANRVRGLAVPSASINYYPAIGSVPPDSYNTQTFEVSRGPNSMLYGIGSPAGVVNQSTIQARVDKNTASFELSTDDRGSFRTSLSFNQKVIPNKLAIFGAVLYNDQQFERKPSYDITRRQYVALTYKPFSKTTITANYERYSNSNRRPNTISPVDYVTQWNLAGRPVYDSLSKQISLLSTNQVAGVYVASAGSPNADAVRNYIKSLPTYNASLIGGGNANTFTTYNGVTIFGQGALNPTINAANPNPFASILYVPGVSEQTQSRAVMQISGGQLWNWFQPLYGTTYRTGYNNPSGGTEPTIPSTTSTSPLYVWGNSTWADMYNRDYYYSNGWTNNSFITNVGNYKYPGITDRSILDWKKVNVNQMNFGKLENQNYNLELTHELTKEIFVSAGWFRQDARQTTNYTLAQLNAAVVRVDINKYLPDGSSNPFFGKPFVADVDPDQYENNELDDHYRAMIAYTPDFRDKENWLKWLGHHQFISLWSRDKSMALARRLRLNYVAAGSQAAAYRYLPNPNPASTGPTGWHYTGQTSLARNFYLADADPNHTGPMGVATHSAGPWDAQSYTGNIRVFNYQTNQFEDANVTTVFNTWDSPTRSQTIINSWSGGMTNYLWNERIITTFGARIDKYRVRNTSTGAITLDNGNISPALTNQQKFDTNGFFIDDSIWYRFNQWSRLTGRTKTGGGVFRPFSGWSAIERNAKSGNQFWQIVQSLGISYNWSDNFNAPTKAEVDSFGKPLPKPSGIGHDLGFQFSALDGKLFARITWYKANNLNQRITGDVVLSRFNSNVDTTIFRDGWARQLAMANVGIDPSVTATTAVPAAQEQAVRDQQAIIWGQTYNYYGDLPGTVTPTQDSKVKGMEVQINYNEGNWRNRFTFGSQETVNSNAYAQYAPWAAIRLPYWKNAAAANFLNPTALALLQGYATAAGHPGSIGYNNSGGTFVDLTNFWTGTGFGGVSPGDQFGNTTPQTYFANNVQGNLTLALALNGQAAPGQRKYRWAYNTGYDFARGTLKGFGVGGALRWESKSVIGYLGKAGGTTLGTANANPNLLDTADTSKPVYDKANYYADLFVKYSHKLWKDQILWTTQLNIENVTEGGRLQVVGVNYDGSPYGYRIIDSRRFVLTSTFEF